MARYFLSYARADAPFALRLADDLRASGVDLWIDQRDIAPSQRWDRAVEAALRDCAAVVAVLSPRAVASENVLDEIGCAPAAGGAAMSRAIPERRWTSAGPCSARPAPPPRGRAASTPRSFAARNG